jgi:ubiquitin C-terminal hydrolase
MCGYKLNDQGFNDQLKNFIETVFDTFQNFKYGEQQDLQEFLSCFLEYFDKACEMIDLIVQQNRIEESRLEMLFNVFLVNKRRCDTCDNMMNPIYEQGRFLSLSINHDWDTNHNYSLNAALDLFFSVESITDRSEWVNDCEICQITRPGKKNPYQRRYLLVEAPKILIIQLKRFGVSYNIITFTVITFTMFLL